MVGSIRAYWRIQPSVLQCETEEGDLEVKWQFVIAVSAEQSAAISITAHSRKEEVSIANTIANPAGTRNARKRVKHGDVCFRPFGGRLRLLVKSFAS